MTHEKFSELLSLLRPSIERQNSRFRCSIDVIERLSVCLRFLATGDTFGTIAMSYRLGETTVREIVYQVCEEIWRVLSPKFLPVPNKEKWKNVAEEFQRKWNFPNCVGALDGKHVITDKPPNSGSRYFNYKKSFSIILLALVDANYRFLAIDVGSYGRNSDGGVFSSSEFGRKFFKDELDFPEKRNLPGTNILMPHVIVADEAFPLHEHLMRPFPGSQTSGQEDKKIFNYRLSRARRVSENAFGILVKKFRLYQRKLQISPEHLDKVVLATCCLHNFLRDCDVSGGISEEEQEDDRTIPQGLIDIPGIGGNPSLYAVDVREKFKNYFVSETGSLPWQVEMVRRGRKN
ncbi:protein ANTAGONIST OF LIKE HETEROCHROMATIN PROTEIN 1-like [Sitophilus oryzae]|uniref:Protein ANTAGONIST OF LIKE HETEROCHROMATIN PROTEIN 1-like n=2 Tax=Sitophilus oryzae TaxID=7048 RepID=A0A6J2Y284_SITOR|nr:protein ANTAGONIST OF LIKE HETEROCHROMATIN PROTEIN 1-like [Sitophilus oryzae]XP_030760291.1 protein ANTAGONIST OF LIKE HETEROCHROMATIN PROTEIN 1-like [Sitophilus oryzae]